MTDWQAWHADYDDATTSLSRRLVVVRQRLTELLHHDRAPRTILSLCAGDGRDIVPLVATLLENARPAVTLVELDPTLADAARQRARDAGLHVTVITGDAGLVDSWRHETPVDLLMLCGIFGNVSDDDVRTIVRSLPTFLNPRGAVIWTRGHRSGVDVRTTIRRRFTDAGFEEIAFDSEPTGYGVGVNRLDTATTTTEHTPDRLFSFIR
jgi:protein-L-isoaspartate O-methyltransferase